MLVIIGKRLKFLEHLIKKEMKIMPNKYKRKPKIEFVSLESLLYGDDDIYCSPDEPLDSKEGKIKYRHEYWSYLAEYEDDYT